MEPEQIHPVVVFEGLDHAGKTTNAVRLARDVGGTYLYSIPEELRPFKSAFDSMEPRARLEYYLTSNRIVGLRMQDARKSAPVIGDRYFFTTLAFMPLVIGDDLDQHLESMVVRPDRVYYLKAEYDELERRLQKTGLLSARDFRHKSSWAAVEGNYRRLLRGFSVLELDTTYLDEDAVYSIIADDFEKISRK